MAAIAALKAHKDRPFISHKWEELVSQLCNDNDPHLRESMRRELDDILGKDPGFKSFLMSSQP
jgi:hypothetical protein